MDDPKAHLNELIKRHQEAVFRESCIREVCFLPVTFELCGVEVNQFTPYHYLLLDFYGSPWVRNELPSKKDNDEFLWVVSTKFKMADKQTHDLFVQQLQTVEFEKQVVEIQEYILDAVLDLPSAIGGKDIKRKNNIPHFSWIASYVDILASEYGWTSDEVIHMPIARILTLCKVIDARQAISSGKEPTLQNPSDTIRNEITIAKTKL